MMRSEEGERSECMDFLIEFVALQHSPPSQCKETAVLTSSMPGVRVTRSKDIGTEHLQVMLRLR